MQHGQLVSHVDTDLVSRAELRAKLKRTLSQKEAVAICGSLSEPSKMPGHAYSLPARNCRIGSLLQQLSKAVCSHCYALRGRYVFPVVRRAMERRLASLSHPRWVEAITALILRSRDAWFRWHDSGDIQAWSISRTSSRSRGICRR